MLRLSIIAAALLLGSAKQAPPPDPDSDKHALLAACDGKHGWRDPAPPVRIDGNVFYVGTCGITSLLITSPQGHVLIDSAEEEAVPLILANVRQLGFEPRDNVVGIPDVGSDGNSKALGPTGDLPLDVALSSVEMGEPG